MKVLRRNMRLIGALVVVMFIALAGWFAMTVYTQGAIWASDAHNTRLSASNTLRGDITDRHGNLLATTASDGSRQYTQNEQARRALMNVKSIGCTACRYCVDGCPMNIPIPDIFRAMNEHLIYNTTEASRRRYRNATKEHGRATDCIACGQCEAACPQQLPVIRLLKESAAVLETSES